jgi:hypothetical protein
LTKEIHRDIINIKFFDNFKKERRKIVMKYCLLIRFNGCLNGRRDTTINLVLIQFKAIDYTNQLLMSELTEYLYQKRGKGELGHRNGPGTAGWLEVVRVNTAKPSWFLNDCKTLTVNSFVIRKVYE